MAISVFRIRRRSLRHPFLPEPASMLRRPPRRPDRRRQPSHTVNVHTEIEDGRATSAPYQASAVRHDPQPMRRYRPVGCTYANLGFDCGKWSPLHPVAATSSPAVCRLPDCVRRRRRDDPRPEYRSDAESRFRLAECSEQDRPPQPRVARCSTASTPSTSFSRIEDSAVRLFGRCRGRGWSTMIAGHVWVLIEPFDGGSTISGARDRAGRLDATSKGYLHVLGATGE